MDEILENQKNVSAEPSAQLELDEIINKPEVMEGMTKEQIVGIIRRTSVEFAGPLPPPSMLKQYDDIVPGSAKKMMTWVESEQKHRHSLDNKMVNTEARDSLLGILSAGIVSLALIIVGLIVILTLRTTAGTIVGGVIDVSGIAAVVGTYLKGTKASWRDNSSNNSSKDDASDEQINSNNPPS